MKRELENRIAALIQSLDDCWSINGEATNLAGLVHNAKELRAIRRELRKAGFKI
jgi:hypothetical protein